MRVVQGARGATALTLIRYIKKGPDIATRLIQAGMFALLTSTVQAAEPKSYIVVDLNTQQVVVSRSQNLVLPIASITKLMALVVILDARQPLNEDLEVIKEHVGGHKKVSPGMLVSRRDLINLSLINSDNRAIKTLAAFYPDGESALIMDMNAKAKSLGMNHSVFREPTGLSRDNLSTAQDLVILLMAAANYPVLTENNSTRIYTAPVRHHDRWSVIRANNTNPSISDRMIISKTGFTSPAGFCLAWTWQSQDKHYAGVVLNHPSKQSRKQQVDRLLALL